MAREILKDFDVRLLDSGFAYHISDRNVSKGKALEFISDRLGIPVKGFAVVGDSENDIDMFRVAGFRIAVANADIRLKELADLVTPSNDGDGVIEALEFLRLI
jgi:phosphoglycolate phosphatase (TIGR01487 family)